MGQFCACTISSDGWMGGGWVGGASATWDPARTKRYCSYYWRAVAGQGWLLSEVGWGWWRLIGLMQWRLLAFPAKGQLFIAKHWRDGAPKHSPVHPREAISAVSGWWTEIRQKKASDGRHDARNPDGFNDPPTYLRCRPSNILYRLQYLFLCAKRANWVPCYWNLSASRPSLSQSFSISHVIVDIRYNALHFCEKTDGNRQKMTEQWLGELWCGDVEFWSRN